MKERHWTNLVSSLKCGQCVLVLGPEVPAETQIACLNSDGTAHITYTDALKELLKDELEDERLPVSATCLAGVSQQYEDAAGFGSGALRTVAAQFYASSRFEPSAIHSAIASLPFQLIISTCHDKLLATAMEKAGKTPMVCRYNFRGDRRDNPEFALPWSDQTPLIYQLFGDSADPQSLVLSENDLLDFLVAVISEQPPLPNSLRRAMQRSGQSLLFVGFGLRHWYLRVIMKALLKTLVRGAAASQAASAFALEPFLHGVPDAERQQTILFYQRGTRVEICNDEVTEFFVELSKRLDDSGGVVAKPTRVGPRAPHVFVSYASEDQGLAAKMFASLQQAGLEPWLDKDGLRGGEDWNMKIEDQLRESDYVLVLQTPALAAKRVGYVNKEIAIAREQARSYRGAFLIPIVANNLPVEDRLEDLAGFQQLPVLDESYEQDVSTVVSTILRDFQLRQR